MQSDRDRQTDRHRQTGRKQNERCAGRQIEESRQTDWWTKGQSNRKRITDRQTDRQTYRQEKNRMNDMQVDR